MRRPFRFALVLLPVSAMLLESMAAPASAESLLGLELGDLMKVKVMSLHRREGEFRTTAAPMHILTTEDIRRSGATNIPDLLRLVPGLHVARANGNTWAISSRGLNSTIANKLLVMIDGRSVYSSLHAGVFWDVQDIPLSSIERIEIISGPGGALWGANAVNGIINIIRKSAAARSGTSVSVTVGDEERFIGNVSHGGAVGNTSVVAYGRYREVDDTRRVGGGNNGDDGRFGIGGFRADGNTSGSAWMVSGDAYAGRFGENRTAISIDPPASLPYRDDTDVNGANVVGHLRRKVRTGTVMFSGFFDRSERRIPRLFHEVRDTLDANVQHELATSGRHRLTYGAGMRTTSDRVGNSLAISWVPTAATDRIFSLFAQDHVRLSRRTFAEAGAKLERNDYSGWEVQPNARFGFQLRRNHLLWAAVSRAVRTPTRFDRNLLIRVFSGPTLFEARGGPDFDAEKVVTYEAGYRAQPTTKLYSSFNAFYNTYSDLRTFEPRSPEARTDPVPHTAVPVIQENRARAESYGGETSHRLQLTDNWQIEAQYALLHLRLHLEDGSRDFTVLPSEGNDPQHQAALLSHWNIRGRFEIDGVLRWVDDLDALGIDEYTAIDLRAGWEVTPRVDIELAGRNLFETSHREFSGTSEIEPSVHGKVSCRFR